MISVKQFVSPRSEIRGRIRKGAKQGYEKKKYSGEKHLFQSSLYPENWQELSSEIKARDEFKCKINRLLPDKRCDAYFPPPFSHLLHAHHIIPLPKGSNHKRNLVCLCHSCHGLIHKRKLGYTPTYKQKSVAKKINPKRKVKGYV